MTLLPWHLWVINNYGLKEIIFSTPTFSYEQTGVFKFWLKQRFYNLQGAFLPIILFEYINEETVNIFKNIWVFLGFQDRLLNFYFGAIPGVLTLSGTLFIFNKIVSDKSLIRIKNHLFYLFIILSGFLGDIFFVNNADVAIGVAQNSMMPLCVLLIIFLVGELNKSLSNRRLCFIFGGLIFSEFILTWGMHIFILLFLPLKSTFSFFQNNFQLKFNNNLIFNYDFFSDKHWVFLIFVSVCLFYVFITYLKKTKCPF